MNNKACNKPTPVPSLSHSMHFLISKVRSLEALYYEQPRDQKFCILQKKTFFVKML